MKWNVQDTETEERSGSVQECLDWWLLVLRSQDQRRIVRARMFELQDVATRGACVARRTTTFVKGRTLNLASAAFCPAVLHDLHTVIRYLSSQ